MQLPNIIWPLSQLGTDVLNGAACTMFALAHWVAAVTGQPINDADVLASYEREIIFRRRPAGLTVPEGFFAANAAGWVPTGTTIRRTHDLSRLAYGPIIATYEMRYNSRKTANDGIIDNTGAIQGRHTMLIIGWDGEHVVLANSWGPDWGDRGIGRMPLEIHDRSVLEMWQVVVPGQPSTPAEAAKAASEAIPDDLADQVAAVQRNLIALGYKGLPTSATIIMPDIIRRSMAGDLTPDQERAKSNLAHVYVMLLLQGINDAQINAVHAATTNGGIQ